LQLRVMQKCVSYNKRSGVNDGGVEKLRVAFAHGNPECAVQRAFIYMDGNSLSRAQQTEEEM
jgi:hypothetical protein